jgi:hypothetical protein
VFKDRVDEPGVQEDFIRQLDWFSREIQELQPDIGFDPNDPGHRDALAEIARRYFPEEPQKHYGALPQDLDGGLWRTVNESLGTAAGEYVPKAEALATLAVRTRGLMRAGNAAEAAKVNAAIDALQGMDEEQWAAELASQHQQLSSAVQRA